MTCTFVHIIARERWHACGPTCSVWHVLYPSGPRVICCAIGIKDGGDVGAETDINIDIYPISSQHGSDPGSQVPDPRAQLRSAQHVSNVGDAVASIACVHSNNSLLVPSNRVGVQGKGPATCGQCPTSTG
jgi:hypothetical protein